MLGLCAGLICPVLSIVKGPEGTRPAPPLPTITALHPHPDSRGFLSAQGERGRTVLTTPAAHVSIGISFPSTAPLSPPPLHVRHARLDSVTFRVGKWTLSGQVLLAESELELLPWWSLQDASDSPICSGTRVTWEFPKMQIPRPSPEGRFSQWDLSIWVF